MSDVKFLYPRGFSVIGSDVGDENRVTGDPEITRLYREMLDNPKLQLDWTWMRNVFIAGKRLMGNDFYQWVLQQEANRYLNDMGIRFIADTIKFIAEGKREVSVIGWLGALTNDPEAGIVRDRKFHLSPDHVRAAQGINIFFLQRWLSQSSGFFDFLTTMYICYGEHDRTYAIKKSGANNIIAPQAYAALLLKQHGIDPKKPS